MSDPKIKYIAVELLKKGSSNAISVDHGLFKGIKMRSDSDPNVPKIVSFLLIEKADDEGSVHGFNLDKFGILSISHRCDDKKELIVYKDHVADQKVAIDLLETFAVQLVKEKRMVKNDPEIIDVTTYTDIPNEIKKAKSKYPVKNSYCGGGIHHNQNNNGNTATEWEIKRKEREVEEKRQEGLRKIPTVFKREGESPGLKSLNLMKKKVLAITTGEYESKILPGKEEDEDDDDIDFTSGFVAG